MPVQASIRLLALVLRRSNHMLANPLVPVLCWDYGYEETEWRGVGFAYKSSNITYKNVRLTEIDGKEIS